MTTSATLNVDYGAMAECKGVLFELPTQEITAGDTIELRLWGGTAELLAPYTLYKGTGTMGAGTLIEEISVLEIAPVIDFAETFKHQLDYPIISIDYVEAITEMLIVDEGNNSVLTWAAKGEDVTAKFARMGYSCIYALDRIPIYGSIIATCTRAPYKKFWEWTIPEGAEGLHWFFIYKENMELDHKFSIELPDLAGSELAYRNITLKAIDSTTDVGIANAVITLDNIAAGTTDINGELYIDQVRTGDHSLHISAAGYLDTDADDLNNETLTVY